MNETIEYKQYTRKEVKSFCEQNFMEDSDWLWKFVKGCKKVHLSTETGRKFNDGNIENILIIKIGENGNA